MEKNLAYYINNCTSCEGCPRSWWSAVCDVIYWNQLYGSWIGQVSAGEIAERVFYKWIGSWRSVEELFDDLVDFTSPVEDREHFKRNLKARYRKEILLWI